VPLWAWLYAESGLKTISLCARDDSNGYLFVSVEKMLDIEKKISYTIDGDSIEFCIMSHFQDRGV
jgi:hypothetical protein